MSTDYRCPYCGEPAFSLRVKLGIVSQFGTAPQCPHCKRVAERSTGGGHVGYGLFLGLLAIAAIACLVLAVNYKIAVLFPIGLILFLCAYLLFQYFFCHFDKAHRKDKLADSRFQFSSSATERLWPWVREGEIYEMQFPDKNRQDTHPRIIGMLETLDGKSGDRRFTVRIIRLQDMELPLPGERLRLVTDGMLVVEGTVT